jgi:hypothetical protein
MRSRRPDIDADALKREHLEPFDIGDDFIFFDDEVIRVIMIVYVVVHCSALKLDLSLFLQK